LRSEQVIYVRPKLFNLTYFQEVLKREHEELTGDEANSEESSEEESEEESSDDDAPNKVC
jgi:hypothetical protein